MVCPKCKEEVAPIHGYCPQCATLLPTSKEPISRWLYAGLISAIISVFFMPVVFGALGVLCGIITMKDHKYAGLILITASLVCLSIGLLLGLKFDDIIINYDQ